LKDVLVLGHHLTAELGLEDGVDTLGKWMAHHLAELMVRVENETDPEKKSEHQSQTVDLILKIWGRRTALEGDAYPLSRFKSIIGALSILSPEANIWERNRLGKYESLAADTYSILVDLYKALLFVDFVAIDTVKSKQVPPSTLSDEEQELYEILLSWADKTLDYLPDDKTEKTEMELATKRMCVFIDELSVKLIEIKDALNEK